MYQQRNKLGRLFVGVEAREVARLRADGNVDLAAAGGARSFIRWRRLAAAGGEKQGRCDKQTKWARVSGQNLTRRLRIWPSENACRLRASLDFARKARVIGDSHG